MDKTEKHVNFMDWWEIHSHEYKALLFDIDGTLITGKETMQGADRAIGWLRQHKYPFYLLTNDGNHSLKQKSSFLKRAGLDISPDEIVSCSSAIREYVMENSLDDAEFFVMGELGKPDFAEEAGLRVTRDTSELDNCEGVIIGEGRYDWQLTFSAVINSFSKNSKRPFLVPNPDSYWPSGEKGEYGVGAGGKARFIKNILREMGIHIELTYLGKPYRMIFEYTFLLLFEKFGLPQNTPHSKVLMLGDSLDSDIKGANDFGAKSGIVLTGITDQNKAENAENSRKPDFIFEKLG